MKTNRKLIFPLLSFVLLMLFGNLCTVSAETGGGSTNIELVYFYSTTCGSCSRISEFLESLSSEGCSAEKYNIYNQEDMKLLNGYCMHYHVPEDLCGTVPVIFAGDTYYLGEDDILSGVKALADRYENGESMLQTAHRVYGLLDEITSQESGQKKLSLLRVVTSALVNGLNPCSLSMFLFLVMLLINNNSKSILKIGISYCIGKVISFFLIGTVLFRFFSHLNNQRLISVINWIIILVYFVLFLMNLRDFIVLKTKQKKDMLAQLPTGFRKFNHQMMRRFSSQSNQALLPVFGLLLGALIACTEFLCSGQIYITAIVETAQSVQGDRLFAALCLLLYSLIFVLPLLAVILFMAFGKKLFEISSFFRKHTAAIKLAYALFFLVFVIYMIGKELF